MLGQILKQKRLENEMSQTDVAVAVGVSLNAYQLWERGASKPNAGNWLKLKKVLDLDDLVLDKQ